MTGRGTVRCRRRSRMCSPRIARANAQPKCFARFSGILQVDGYAGYNGLLDPHRQGGAVTLAFCFAHPRRKFYDVHVATGSPIAAEALRRIGEFYGIEDRIRGKPAAIRCAVRQAETKPLTENFKLRLGARGFVYAIVEETKLDLDWYSRAIETSINQNVRLMNPTQMICLLKKILGEIDSSSARSIKAAPSSTSPPQMRARTRPC
jgi:hypothetical protein